MFEGKAALNNYSIKQSLPCVKGHVPLSVSTNNIMNAFQSVAKSNNFEIIEME